MWRIENGFANRIESSSFPINRVEIALVIPLDVFMEETLSMNDRDEMGNRPHRMNAWTRLCLCLCLYACACMLACAFLCACASTDAIETTAAIWHDATGIHRHKKRPDSFESGLCCYCCLL